MYTWNYMESLIKSSNLSPQEKFANGQRSEHSKFKDYFIVPMEMNTKKHVKSEQCKALSHTH